MPKIKIKATSTTTYLNTYYSTRGHSLESDKTCLHLMQTSISTWTTMLPILNSATPYVLRTSHLWIHITALCLAYPSISWLNLHFYQPRHNGSNPHTSPRGSPTIHPPSPLEQRRFPSVYRQSHHKCHLKYANIRLRRAA